MTPTRSLILFDHEIRAALRGELGLVARPVESVKRIGRVTEFGPSDTPGYDFIMRDNQKRWNDLRHADLLTRCTLGVPGTRLVCKEMFVSLDDDYKVVPRPHDIKGGPWKNIAYQADQIDPKGDGPANPVRWRSPATMPAWASRITLEVVSVGVGRLHEINAEDVTLCGVKTKGEAMWGDRWWIDAPLAAINDARGDFAKIWDVSYSKRGLGWDTNPWAWKVAVRRWT